VTLLQCFKLLRSREYQHIRVRPLHSLQFEWLDIEHEISYLQEMEGRVTQEDSYEVKDNKITIIMYANDPERGGDEALIYSLPFTQLIGECRKPLR
jgi:hypothetical protein